MKYAIAGDTHERFDIINKFINKHQPKHLIICGDFGFWLDNHIEKRLKPHNTKIYFCDGNHEDHNLLDKLTDKPEPVEVCKNVFYMPRGTIVQFEDKKFLFMGGAESIDKDLYTEGIDWFPQESITIKQVNSLPETNIDVIISHAAPLFVEMHMGLWMKSKLLKQTPILLETVFELYKPKHWFFGHYHYDYYSVLRGTEFHGMNMSNSRGWWKNVDNILFK